MGILKKAVICVCIAGMALSLAACGGKWAIKVTKNHKNQLEMSGEIGGNFLREGVASINIGDVRIDVAGTDIAVPTQGNVSVVLKDGGGGLLSSATFRWNRIGMQLHFANPAEVQAWMSRFPTAANVDFSIPGFILPSDGRSHVVATALTYQGDVKAAARGSFVNDCGPHPKPELCVPF